MSDSGNNGGDVKPAVTSYELTIVDNGNEYPLTVKVKPNTQIVKVLKVWCTHHTQELKDWVFMLDGDRLKVVDDEGNLSKLTIADLDIDEDCQIDALRHQVGGCL